MQALGFNRGSSSRRPNLRLSLWGKGQHTAAAAGLSAPVGCGLEAPTIMGVARPENHVSHMQTGLIGQDFTEKAKEPIHSLAHSFTQPIFTKL